MKNKNKTKKIGDNRKGYQLWTILNRGKGTELGGPYTHVEKDGLDISKCLVANCDLRFSHFVERLRFFYAID